MMVLKIKKLNKQLAMKQKRVSKVLKQKTGI